MTRLSIMLVMLVLAGCGRQHGPPAERAPDAAGTDSAGTAPHPTESHQPSSPASPEPFFVGRWASEADNCPELAWVITEQGLQTPGEVTCDFHRVERTTRGFEADATCTAEGPPREWKLQFSYAQSARALLIQDGPFADIGLVRCDDSTPRPGRSAASDVRADATAFPEPPGLVTEAQRAAAVLQRYYVLLEAGRYHDAWKLWSQGGRASGMTAEAFARSFADYETYHATPGKPGRVEGAAGSLFVSIPVQIDGRQRTGDSVHLSGQAILRRTNDVPGSTAEQRSWRIYRLDLQPVRRGE